MKIVVDLTAHMDIQQKRLQKVERLLEQLLEARKAKRSEQLSRDQLALFGPEAAAGEVTVEAVEEDPEDPDEDPPSSAGGCETGRSRGRTPLASHLKRERIDHDLADSEKHCADCGEDLRPIGEETSGRYEYVPVHMVVIEDVCRKCLLLHCMPAAFSISASSVARRAHG
jgi:transposase